MRVKNVMDEMNEEMDKMVFNEREDGREKR